MGGGAGADFAPNLRRETISLSYRWNIYKETHNIQTIPFPSHSYPTTRILQDQSFFFSFFFSSVTLRVPPLSKAENHL